MDLSERGELGEVWGRKSNVSVSPTYIRASLTTSHGQGDMGMDMDSAMV